MIDIIRSWQEIAKYLGVHKETAQRWAKTKNLPYARIRKNSIVTTKFLLDTWKDNNNFFYRWSKYNKETILFINDNFVIGWDNIGALLQINKLTIKSWIKDGLPIKFGLDMGIKNLPVPILFIDQARSWINSKIMEQTSARISS